MTLLVYFQDPTLTPQVEIQLCILFEVYANITQICDLFCKWSRGLNPHIVHWAQITYKKKQIGTPGLNFHVSQHPTKLSFGFFIEAITHTAGSY